MIERIHGHCVCHNQEPEHHLQLDCLSSSPVQSQLFDQMHVWSSWIMCFVNMQRIFVICPVRGNYPSILSKKWSGRKVIDVSTT